MHDDEHAGSMPDQAWCSLTLHLLLQEFNYFWLHARLTRALGLAQSDGHSHVSGSAYGFVSTFPICNVLTGQDLSAIYVFKT